MIHQPSHGAQGKISDTRIAVEEGIKIREITTRIMAEKTWQSYEKVLDDMDRDKWFSPQEALDYGIVDKIISAHVKQARK